MRMEGGKQVAAEADTAAAGMGKVEESAVAANKASAASASSLGSTLKKAGSSMKTVGSGMTKYLTLPIVGVAAVTGKMAIDFDRDMRNVNSIAGLPKKQFESLRQQVLDMAGPTAQAPHVLAEGLYDLVSSGFDAKESIGILHASALGASAGLTTTEISTKAVAAALNAYELPAGKAAAVTDTLFETVNRGVVTFPELASVIGDVLPFSSQLGVNLNEVGASISTMTKAGLSGGESVTRLKNAMVGFIKPSKPLAELLGEMGTTGEKLVAKKGFQGALEAIVKHTNGTKEAIAELFPNIRAMGGVLALTGLHAKSAAEDQEAFKNTTGATQKVLEEQEESFGFQLQRSWSELQAVLIEVGEAVLPVVVPMIEELASAVKSAAEWFTNLSPPLQKALLVFLGVLAISGPILVFLGTLATAIAALDAVLTPVLLIPAAVIAAGVAFYVAYQKIEGFRNAVDAVVGFIKSNWTWLAPVLVGPFVPFIVIIAEVIGHLGWLKNAANNVVAFFQALPGRIMDAIRALPRLIGTIIGRVTAFMLLLPIRIPITIVQMGIKLVQALINIAPGAASAGAKIAAALGTGIAHGASHVWGFIKTIPGRLSALVSEIVPALVGIGGEMGKALAQGLFQSLPGPVRDALETGAGVASEGAGIVGEGLGAAASVFGGLATGTDYWRGGLSLVGEQGPEIVSMPRGSQVIPAGRTSRLLSGSEAPPRGSGYAAAWGGAGGGSRPAITVPVFLNGRQIAEAQVEELENATARL
jgi:TP901 family phage tail tape measure protein